VRLDDHPDDGALHEGAAPAGSRGGQAARQPGVPRHPASVRPPEPGQAEGVPRPGRGPVLSLANQGRRRRRLLDRLGRPGRGHDRLRLADPGLSGGARSGEARADGPDDLAAGRRRAGRGQHLRSPDRGLQARHPQHLVDRRLQSPEPGRDHPGSDVHALRRDLRGGRLDGRDAEVVQAPARSLRQARRRGAEGLDRDRAQRPLRGPQLPGRRGLAGAAEHRSGRRRRRLDADRGLQGRRSRRTDDGAGRPLHGDHPGGLRAGQPGRRAAVLHRLHRQGPAPAVPGPQGQSRRPDDRDPDRRAARPAGRGRGRGVGRAVGPVGRRAHGAERPGRPRAVRRQRRARARRADHRDPYRRRACWSPSWAAASSRPRRRSAR
jgi:hypothetical protein